MKWWEGIDFTSLILYLALASFGALNIYSVDEASGTRQMVWLGISIFVGLFIFLTRNKLFENLASIIYIAGVLLLIGLFPFGKEVLGQKNWYKFGPISLQPVEFAKLGTALMLASYASRPEFDLKDKKSLYTALAIIGIPAVVVLAIPDVGSLLVFGAFFIALYREGLSGWFFGVIAIFAIVFLLALYFHFSGISLYYQVFAILAIIGFYLFFNMSKISWNIVTALKILGAAVILCGLTLVTPTVNEKLPKHQRERIEVLYKGERQFRDTSGYNLLFSKTAIGSGDLFGKGYREGSVTRGRFVPEQQTDYIFCTVGEEWGFVGSSTLVILYIFYIGRLLYLAERQKNAFNRIFGYSFAGILIMHFSINLGMVMGLFPTVGIPLPYFSYGGSSLLAFSIMTFVFFKLNYSDTNSLV
ncbi:rod shape-determining protein RodA [Elizabethkingia sp. JS20170427COW]|uniref:rod shape-determining protein RodA n=1 Tax=Elizabethkingia sp. JS20170427COW TaxID=2583851 RepID=UPI00111024B2|nr:rod shape-determining protein RodA [Elizabethkingia sp. JS20170427COW]QCX53052.1 rod shape-determining protein RodA [Elizabethkingia sp. JS20170427COW]